MRKIISMLVFVFFKFSYCGITNFETVLDIEKSKTLNLINNKKKEVIKSSEKYHDTLLKKQKALSNLLFQLQGIEVLLKKQYYIREQIIKNLQDKANNSK